MYLHGGGYSGMSAKSHRHVMAEIARFGRARCLGVDYRRSPEHPFPAAVEDTVSAYISLLEGGTPASDMAIAGDSAGGGLLLAALTTLRDRAIPLPAAGIAFSPWTDLVVTGPSADQVDDPIVSGAALRSMARAYLAGADPYDPMASPLYGDPAGLPPLLIQVGTREALLDDSRRYARLAEGRGVTVNLVEYPDVIHMWMVFDPAIPESQEAFGLAGAFLDQYLPAPS
jgi:acetyl esterase/lipase